MNTCLQCQQPFAQSPKFCPECGAALTGAVGSQVAAVVVLAVIVMVVVAVLKGIGCIMAAFVLGLAGRKA